MDNYLVYDKGHQTCKHDSGAWKVEDGRSPAMYICPDCGLVLAYTFDLESVYTSSTNDTFHILPQNLTQNTKPASE